jgi:hypothetical protein
VYNNARSRPEHTTILAWTRYTDVSEEYANSIAAIYPYYKDFTISQTMTLDATELQAALADKDVFLIPEQEYEDCYALRSVGTSWTAVLTQFLQQGGTLIVLDYSACGGGSHCILDGAGLMDVAQTSCSYYTGSYRVRAVDPSHPLLKDVPATFYGANGTIHYTSTDGTEIVEETTAGASVVLTKDVGNGHIALIGFDFYEYNDDMARLLANAVQWR